MAASSVLLSLAWLTERDLFKAFLEAGHVSRSEMESFVKPEFADNIFKGLNQFYFWSSKLCDIENEAAISLAVMGHNGLIKPNIKELHRKITLLLGPGKLKNINYPENTNFVTLLLESAEAAQAVRHGVLLLDEALVCYVKRRPHNNFKVRILWAPLLFPLEGIHNSLKPWCASSNLEFEMNRFDNGEAVPTNIITGTVTLKDNVSLQQLPHVVKLENTNNKFIMLVIRERAPLCLKCRHEGHIRKFCSWTKCSKCVSYHNADDTCNSRSYASVIGFPSTRSAGAPHTSLFKFNLSEDTAITGDKPIVQENSGPSITSDNEAGITVDNIANITGSLSHTMDTEVEMVTTDSAGLAEEGNSLTKSDHENYIPVVRRGIRKLSNKLVSLNGSLQVQTEAPFIASSSFQGLDDEMDQGDNENDDSYASESESDHCLQASAVEDHNKLKLSFKKSNKSKDSSIINYHKKGKKQKRNNTNCNTNKKMKKQHSGKNRKSGIIVSSLGIEEHNIQNLVAEDNRSSQGEKLHNCIDHEPQVGPLDFGFPKVDGVLTRAAAKAQTYGSLEKEIPPTDVMVASQNNENKVEALVQVNLIVEDVPEDTSKFESLDGEKSEEESTDDENLPVLQFPVKVSCHHCKTLIHIRQRPENAVQCSGCHTDFFLNSARTRFED